MTAIENRIGQRHEFTYDSRGTLPLIGTSKRSVDPTQPMVVAYQPRLTRIAERSADGQLTGAYVDFFYEETSGRLTHVIASDGRRINYSHDPIHGNLTAVTGLENYTQAFAYADPNHPHLLTTYVSGTGAEPAVNTYDSHGRVAQQTIGSQVMSISYPTETTRQVTWVVKDSVGTTLHTRVHSYQYEGQYLIKETNALGHELRRFYTPSRDLAREEIWQKPASGPLFLLKTKSWTYDGQGRQLTESVTLDSGEVITTTKTYDHGWVASAETTSSLSSQVFRTEYTFYRDAAGVPINLHEIKRKREDGVFATTTYSYCSAADTVSVASGCPYERLLKSVDGPRTDVADVTTLFYYTSTDLGGCSASAEPCHRKGYLRRTSNALDHSDEVLVYDAAGRPTKVRDSNGVITQTTYHARGWPLISTVLGGDPASSGDDANTILAYDARGNLTSRTDADGVATHYVYDTRSRLSEVQDATGGRLIYTYDSDGNRLTEEIRDSGNALRRKRSYSYDKLGRLSIERDAQNRATIYEYDAASRQTAVVDALGHRTQDAYDDFDRIIETVADASSGGVQASTHFTYDAMGNLRSAVDPAGLTTSYTYNSLGQRTQLQSPDTGTTEYTFDLAGNRLTQTDARGVTATHHYDELGRLTSSAYNDATFNVGYAYDQASEVVDCADSFPLGRLTTMTDRSGTTKYCYDRRGNLTSKQQSVVGQTLAVAYTHTLGDRISGLTYPGGAELVYGRDDQGRIETIEQAATPSNLSIITAAEYLPFGPLTELTFAGGSSQSFSYDQNYWINEIDGNALSLDYSTDALGNIISLPDAVATDARVYEYDALSRLTAVKNGAAIVLETFSYDDTGNRLSKFTTNGTQVYNYQPNSHRLANINGDSRGYDEMGNLIAKGSGWTFKYDPHSRLSEISENGVLRQVNLYNGRGERVAKSNPGSSDSLGTYVYDENGHLLAEWIKLGIQSPESVRDHVWFDDRPVAVLSHQDAYSTQILHVHSDHLGTPRSITRPSNANTIVWAWNLRGRVFGEDASSTDPDADGVALNYSLRFPGQYFDVESGLSYNYFRDYEADTGRYLESDPLGLDGGFSTFAYVESAPLTMYDELGLQACQINCCEGVKWVKKEGGQKAATIVCCGGQPQACFNPNECENFSTAACRIKKGCTRRHEKMHVDYHSSCLLISNGAPAVPQTPHTKPSSECNAYSDEVGCWKESKCRGDIACKVQIKKLRNFSIKQRNKYCAKS